jgi:hypothetical protein
VIGSPGFGDGVDPLPRLFHFITTHEQRLNTTHGFQQQTLVSIRQVRFVEGFGIAQIQLGGLQVVLVIQPGTLFRTWISTPSSGCRRMVSLFCGSSCQTL